MADIVVSFIIILLGFIIIIVRKINSGKRIFTLSFLWLFHLGMTTVFYIYAQSNSNDASGYWKVAKKSNLSDIWFYLQSGPGTNFMYVINYIPANLFDWSFFTGCVFYSLFGFVGFIILYDLAKKHLPTTPKISKLPIFPSILFLPNVHFWSCSVGKDTILFFCIILIVYSFQKPTARFLGILFGFALAIMIRPHVAILLAGAIGYVIVFDSNIRIIYKLLFLIISLIFLYLIMDLTMDFLSLEEISSKAILNRTETHVDNLSDSNTGSAVDVNSYPLPLKIFTFLFRPLFFDAPNLFGIIVSMENLLMLILSTVALKKGFKNSYKNAPIFIKQLFIFLVLATIMFSISLGNLGIMIRMKNMLMPGFILLVLWCISYQRNRSDLNF